MDDGLAVAGRFGKAHVARDDRLEEVVGEAALHLVAHFAGQAVAGIVHGQHQAKNAYVR